MCNMFAAAFARAACKEEGIIDREREREREREKKKKRKEFTSTPIACMKRIWLVTTGNACAGLALKLDLRKRSIKCKYLISMFGL